MRADDMIRYLCVAQDGSLHLVRLVNVWHGKGRISQEHEQWNPEMGVWGEMIEPTLEIIDEWETT